LGETTARYPWFGGVYLILSFLLVPGLVFLLSMAGPLAFYPALAVAGSLTLCVLLINLLQHYATGCLPPVLRSWDFLPLALRSLEPYDAALSRLFYCCGSRAGGSELLDLEAAGATKLRAAYEPVQAEKDTVHSRTPIIKNLGMVGAIPSMAEEKEPILVTTQR
jgi:hypothetical protein